jgi:thimet oligopeptidase
LYPRENKYGHAAHAGVIHSIKQFYGQDNPPSVSFVVANFPKPTVDKPSLLKFDDVSTFFHEFGHAMHAMLGRTNIASFSGTNTKLDFVELPSQILEEWLYNKEILEKVSGHYQTGESLPDTIIDTLIKLKTFSSGAMIQGQIYYARIALAYYAQGADKDVYKIAQNLANTMTKNTIVDSENHFYASFSHLTGYGARYYGYLWSKVFALDIFEQIEKEGLLNAQVGQRYINEVIGKGGSIDPNKLLKNFLGREPNDKAFFKSLGL